MSKMIAYNNIKDKSIRVVASRKKGGYAERKNDRRRSKGKKKRKTA